jgi:hypothetical protein
MKYRILGVACLAAGATMALPASAAMAAAGGNGHTVTETVHQHGTWTEDGDTDFCTGAEISPIITGNEVEHVTFFPGGDEVWGTFTEEGTATAQVGDLVYSGRITVWGNFNVNERNANNTFTATVKLSATDENGVVHTEVGHQVSHVSWNAVDQEPVVSFDKMYFTCS